MIVNALPSNCDSPTRVALEAAGVVFGQPVDGDPLFVRAKLPPGWRFVATADPMWTELVDNDGMTRASIFYKPLPFDRRAEIRLA